jgi:glucose/arabinose dehydrogenase/mono/diheme cytochrome c family protein
MKISLIWLGFGLSLVGPLRGSAADPTRGRTVFQQNCAVCHATGQERQPTGGQGPFLAGVVGRPAASLPNFGYTKALRAAQLTWTPAALDQFLRGPAALVPGTAMAVIVPDSADRRDLIAFLATLAPVAGVAPEGALGGPDAGDWRNDAPGVRHSIHLDALPPPFASPSAGNGPQIVDRPAGASLAVPPGFTVRLFAAGLTGPRLIRTAPNGDIFIAETGAGRLRVLRAADGADAPSENRIFAAGLTGPFGLAFYPLGPNPQWLYVGNLNSVVRFPYRVGDLAARGPAEVVVPHLADSTGGHTTRDVAFSLDGRRLFISVGSGSNVADGLSRKSPEEIRVWEAAHGRGAAWGEETNRADILETDPEGRRPLRPYATGIRNAVGIAVNPATGELWVSTNERDALGDDLVPDYLTHVTEGGFYGWPWYYFVNHEDPRHAGERPDLAGQMIVPDVPVQAHSATLEMTFYEATAGVAAFPAEFHGDVFAAFHGSWNRSHRTGSKVVRVLFRRGVPTGEYADFLTGFVVDNHDVWGRPVGVTVAHDGALLVTDDANNTLWRVAYAWTRAPSP